MLRLRPLAAFLCLALVLCLAVFWSARSQTGGVRRVTNTTEEGFNTNPSLSGDGRRIAFESSKDLTGGGGSNFPRAFRADVGADTIAFLQMAAARAPAPGISQDGSIITFAAKENPLGTNPDGNSEIFLFDGVTLRQITNTTPATPSDRARHGNYLPSLSDDGRFIAFSSNRNPASQNGDGNFEIFVFDTLTNSFTQLTNTTGAVGATDAKISGDGSRIAYIRDSGALPAVQRDLVRQDRVGGAVQVLAAGVTNLALTYGRAISDDGTRVVYSGETAANASQLFLFDGRRNAARQLISLGAREDDVPLHPTISGDGLRISFATRRAITALGGNTDNSIELYTYDIPTGQLARVTNATLSNADCFDASNRACEVVSSLNDDGSIVVFNFPRSLSGAVATTGTENNTEIYITGTAPRPLVGSLRIVNGASFGNEPATDEAVAPDSIAVAFGGGLSFETVEASRQSDGSFPRTLGGTTVRVNGRLAQLFFVSPTRVHFHVPAETELGTAEVVITNDEGFRSVGSITVRNSAPGIFTFNDAGNFTLFDDGRGPGAIMNADTLTKGPFDPSSGNLRLVIFTTGVRKAAQVTASAGGRALTVESVMPSPDLPGMDEVRVLVPADLRGVGQVDLIIRADGRDSNPVQVEFSGPPRNIIINEVLADPPDGTDGDANHDNTRDGADDEFVELVNRSTIDIDISGYQLFARSSTATSDTLRHIFAQGTIFPAGSAIVVFGGGLPDVNNPAFGGAQIFIASSGGLALNNAGGVVTLREPSQAVMSIFSYGGSTGLNGGASQSLTRSPDITGNFVLHTEANSARLFSPGTKIDGTPFASAQGRLTSISISPPSATITVGQTQQFTAQARDQFNRPLTNVTITFASDNTTVATVDSVTFDSSTGIATANVTGRSEGTAHITAQATDGTTTLTSSQATLTVNPIPAAVTRVEVSPDNATINRGQTQQFTATAFDQNNQPIANATFSWSSSNVNVATINSSGLATGVGLGSVTITATITDATGTTVSDTSTLTVQVPLVINEILADPPDGIQGDSNRDGTRDADDDEFVELVNNSNAPVDISGVILADATNNRFTFPANTTLAAGRAVIIFGGGSPPANDPAFGGALVFTTSSVGLGNTGDTVTVKLPVGGADVQIATHTYGAEGGDNQSLTRSPDLTGAFVKHTTATNSDGRVFSPGTRVDGTPFGSPPITRIEVSPASAAIDVNATQVFTARAFSNTGGSEIEVQNVSFIWDSSDPTKATVAPTTGASTTATGVAPGNNISIRARAGGQQGAATLTVNSSPPVLTSVTISPLSATINAGQTQQFTGQALDQFGQPIGGVTVTFASNNTTVATVDSVSPTSSTGSATATVTGHTNGSAEIRATATNGTTTVTSTPATLTVAPVASPGDVLISEFRTRGPNGANDEFIELYNRTTAPIDISGYKIFRSNNAGATNLTATINSGVILGPGCHYLLTNSNAGGPYSGSVPGDQTYGTGITADGGIALTIPSGTATTGIIDQVGLSSGSAYKETAPLAPFAGDAEQSYERKPGGAAGNGTDTNNNPADFFLNSGTSNPQNLSSGCLDLNSADLSITKTGAPDPVTTGSNVTYTIIVTNNGAGTAQSVVVTDNLPSDVTFVSCSSSGGGVCNNDTSNNRTITFSQLASGASETITIVATANGAAGTTITNTATVSSATSDPNTTNNSATATTAVQTSVVTPSLNISDVSLPEGNTGATTFTFTVSLSSAAPAGGVTFDIATADETAQDDVPTTEDNDYVAKSETARTIPEGQTSATFAVMVNGDTVFEPNETFLVNVTNVTGATVTDGQAVGTITNDDAQPTITIADASVTEGNSGTSLMTFTVTLTGASQSTVSVNYATADSSATTANSDYDAASGTLNFVSGDTSETFTVTIRGDMNAEGDEMFLVNLSGASGATITDNQALGTIFLDDPFSIAALNTAYSENFDSLAQSLVSSTTPAAWTRAESGTSANTTYTANNGSSTTGDTYSYGTTSSSERALGGLRTGTLVPTIGAFYRNDTGSTINTLQINYTGEEWRLGTASRTDRLDFQYSTDATSLTTGTWTDVNALDFTTPNTTATGAKDGNDPANRTAISSTITGLSIAPGATVWIRWSDFDATGADDGLAVDDFSIAAGINLPTISINDVSLAEGNAPTTTTFTFTVSLSSAAPAGGVSFTINTADGTTNPATAGSDYIAIVNGSGSIAEGGTSTTIDVTVNGDNDVEPNETFFVNLSGVTNATIGDAQGVGTITNDDASAASSDLSLTKTVSNSSPVFGQIITFTIKISNGGPDPATSVQVTDLLQSINFTSVSGTASQGSYDSVTGVWTVGTVAVGTDVATLTITATVASGGPKTNTAEITASGTTDPDSTPNNRATLPAEDDTVSVSFQAFDVAVINEFAVNPSTGNGREYIELLVTAPGGADLRGFVLSDVGGRAGTPGGSEGDITLGTNSFLSNVPQGTYVVIELTVPTGTNNTSILTEDISTTDGNRKLVLKTTGITRTNTFDMLLGGENIQLYGPGGRATGRVVDQVLIGSSQDLVFGTDGSIQAPWGDNIATSTSDNIGQSSGLSGNPSVAFCPTADTLAEFQNNDLRTRFTITASSIGNAGVKNTCVATDESINNH